MPSGPVGGLYPVRTLGGELVTGDRPEDHPWHKGISWSLPNVGTEDFWGGPTYRRGDGYVQLDNNGTMRHDGFGAVESFGGAAGRQLDQIAGGDASYLAGGAMRRIRSDSGEPRRYGMCGLLTGYDPAAAVSP